ncbi:hypothetical protein ACHHYP_20162 [Achlya hypogyna]|uniref:Uncharacterized protein n=1 Tax=Achlya hypogyna TaxID=1202772 RepID=A0A1V9ZPI4_ACHHY|nr:hypothetical protein ACHHYP_20162 [Achlya hypogyna]
MNNEGPLSNELLVRSLLPSRKCPRYYFCGSQATDIDNLWSPQVMDLSSPFRSVIRRYRHSIDLYQQQLLFPPGHPHSPRWQHSRPSR